MRIAVIHISQETNDFVNPQLTTSSFGTGATRLHESYRFGAIESGALLRCVSRRCCFSGCLGRGSAAGAEAGGGSAAA